MDFSPEEIEYLILDDGDEITPACFDFISSLKLKDSFIACDKLGSSRSGYLSADKNACIKFTKMFNQEPVNLFPTTKLKTDAENLYNNVIKDEKQNLKNLTLREFYIEIFLKDDNYYINLKDDYYFSDNTKYSILELKKYLIYVKDVYYCIELYTYELDNGIDDFKL